MPAIRFALDGAQLIGLRELSIKEDRQVRNIVSTALTEYLKQKGVRPYTDTVTKTTPLCDAAAAVLDVPPNFKYEAEYQHLLATAGAWLRDLGLDVER